MFHVLYPLLIIICMLIWGVESIQRDSLQAVSLALVHRIVAFNQTLCVHFRDSRPEGAVLLLLLI